MSWHSTAGTYPRAGVWKRGLAGCRLDNAPKFSGTIKFDLTVDHDGSVRKAESDLSEPRTMLECMTFLLRLAEFDPPKRGQRAGFLPHYLRIAALKKSLYEVDPGGRPRPCGSSKSIMGPSGTTRDGLMVVWLA